MSIALPNACCDHDLGPSLFTASRQEKPVEVSSGGSKSSWSAPPMARTRLPRHAGGRGHTPPEAERRSWRARGFASRNEGDLDGARRLVVGGVERTGDVVECELVRCERAQLVAPAAGEA